MSRPKEFWIGYDGVNERGYWVNTEKPSGISGGGSNRSIHVVDVKELNIAKKKIKILTEALKKARKDICMYNDLSNGYPEDEVVEYIDEALGE